MQEIVNRLLENHKPLHEMTKSKSLDRLVTLLSEEYPEYSIGFNKYHNCLELLDGDRVVWQIYPDRKEVPNTSYRYKRVEDINKLPPGTPLYVRETRNSHKYDYTDENPLMKHVDYTNN